LPAGGSCRSRAAGGRRNSRSLVRADPAIRFWNGSSRSPQSAAKRSSCIRRPEEHKPQVELEVPPYTKSMRGLIAHFASRNGHQNGHRKTLSTFLVSPSRTVTPVNALGSSATVYACVKRWRTPPRRCRSTSIDAAPTDPGSGVGRDRCALPRTARALTLPIRCLRFSQRGARRSARLSASGVAEPPLAASPRCTSCSEETGRRFAP
jgi:hypothetical protein